MPFTVNNGTRLYYETRGEPGRPALLMLKGLARSHRYWHWASTPFEENFHVIHMDNRGVGQSAAPWPPYSTRKMAGDLAAVIQAAGVEKAHVFGISLAGMVSQWLAIDHPHVVDRLVLAATCGGGLGNAADPGAILRLLAAGRKPLAESIVLTAPLVIGEECRQRHPEILELWQEWARREPSPRRGLIGQALAGAGHFAVPHLKKIASPTLVITGDSDRLIPCARSYRLAEEIPGAELRVLPGAGHDFPTEIPEESAQIVTEFLSR